MWVAAPWGFTFEKDPATGALTTHPGDLRPAKKNYGSKDSSKLLVKRYRDRAPGITQGPHLRGPLLRKTKYSEYFYSLPNISVTKLISLRGNGRA